VQDFLHEVQPELADEQFLRLTRDACSIWRQRYRHDATPLVTANVQEVLALLSWAQRAGLHASAFSLRIPRESGETFTSRLREHLGDLPVAIGSANLPQVRSRFRRRGAERIGFLLHENSQHALTHMSQFHRLMHVLSTMESARSQGKPAPSAPAF
jgi:hypothetical protein